MKKKSVGGRTYPNNYYLRLNVVSLAIQSLSSVLLGKERLIQGVSEETYSNNYIVPGEC